MVSTLIPYRRVDDWNALIKKINEKCEKPPENGSCKPLPPLEEAGPDHIWTKKDVETVRDKLKELCKDVKFEAPLEKWILKIHEELEKELEKAWCDCECLVPCDNAREDDEIVYVGTQETSGCESGDCGECPDPEGAAQLKLTVVQLFKERDNYDLHWPKYCELEDEVKELEDELEELEKELDELTEIKNRICAEVMTEEEAADCAEAEAAVDEKQKEVDEKQEELDKKKEERDKEKDLADKALQQINTLAGQTFTQSHSANTQAACQYYSLANYTPQFTKEWTNKECDELPPAKSCFDRKPSRCAVYWTLQRRTVESWVGRCRQQRPPCPYTGPLAWFECMFWNAPYEWIQMPPMDYSPHTVYWTAVLTGGFTPTGRMYITTDDECASYGTSAVYSSDCENPLTACTTLGTRQVYEYRMIFRYSTQMKKINCEGQECPEK
jgi:hypothetical protein